MRIGGLKQNHPMNVTVLTIIIIVLTHSIIVLIDSIIALTCSVLVLTRSVVVLTSSIIVWVWGLGTDPALKPNHPTQRSDAPMNVSSTWCRIQNFE